MEVDVVGFPDLHELRDVDDFKEGGKETHRKTTEGFYDKYRCGKAVDLMSAGQDGTRFAGRRVVQNPDFRITVSMDEASSVSLKFQKDTCQTPRKQVLGAHERRRSQWWFGLAGVNGKTTHGGASFDHSIWVRPTITAIDFRGQCGSETMSRSSHHHHGLAHSFRGAALDDIHRLRFRHWRAAAAPTRLVCVCHKQVLQPRTLGASECATLAKSKAHTKSGESTTCGDLCSKFSSGGDDVDQGIMGLNYLERF